MLIILAALVVLGLGAGPALAQEAHSPYAHQGSDRLQTLTPAEVDGLLAGEGMGMARPAELNAYPGPRHVLDLADSLALSPHQRERTGRTFDGMQARARELGEEVIRAEERLDALFASGTVEPAVLEEAVAEAARLRGELRLVHLRAHLRTREILTPHQVHEYQRLRGYGGAHGH